MVETVVALLLVSTMIITAIELVSGSKMQQASNTDRSKGMTLAQDLMHYILRLNYSDGIDSTLGPDTAEAAAGTYDSFNDVDDFDGWVASPPQDEDANALAGFERWSREVSVSWVKPVDLLATNSASTGIKRICVRVKQGGRIVAEIYAIRTKAWSDNVMNAN